MDVVEAIRQFLQQYRIDPCPVLIAVSGGPDSTALLLAFTALGAQGFTLTAGHVNHHLRGEASDLDQQFAQRLCASQRVPLEVSEGPLDPQMIRQRGVEAAAREVRYRELQRMRERVGARYIVTAHHRNDQAETELMRLLTGSGVERLAGIAPITPTKIIRPLLDVSRADLADFLRDQGIEARSDVMNVDIRFLRNRIRHELIPLLEQYNPRVVESLAALARQVRERSHAFDLLLSDATAKWVRRGRSSSEFHLELLPSDPWLRRAVVWREIRRLSPDTREISSADLVRLVESLATLRRVTVTKNLELVRTGEKVILRPVATRAAAFQQVIRPGTSVQVNGTTVRLERRGAAAPPYTDSGRTFQLFQLPPGEQGESFVIRTRRRGERFQPLGFGNQKKLNEFLIDRKIPRELRDQIPLLTWHDEIVWVAGVEVSEKFKVTEPWRDAFRVSILQNDGQAEIHG